MSEQPIPIVIHDARLGGATWACRGAEDKFYVVCARAQTVVQYRTDPISEVVAEQETPRLPGTPGAATATDTLLWVAWERGIAVYWHAALSMGPVTFIDDDDIVPSAIYSVSENRLLHTRKSGELVLRSANLDGTILDVHDTRFDTPVIIMDVENYDRCWIFESRTNRYLYVEISTSGLEVVLRGTFKHAKQVQGGYARCRYLTLSARELGRVQVYDISDPTEPTLVSDTKRNGTIRQMIYVPPYESRQFLVTLEPEYGPEIPTQLARTFALAADAGLVVLHADDAALTFMPWDTSMGVTTQADLLDIGAAQTHPKVDTRHRAATSPDGTLCAILLTNQMEVQVPGFPMAGVFAGGETHYPIPIDLQYASYSKLIYVNGSGKAPDDNPSSTLSASEYRCTPDGRIQLGAVATAGHTWSVDCYDWKDQILLYELVNGVWQLQQTVVIDNCRIRSFVATETHYQGAIAFTADNGFLATGHPGTIGHGVDVGGVDAGPWDKGSVRFWRIDGAYGSRSLTLVQNLVTPFYRREDWFGQGLAITPDRKWMAVGVPGGDGKPGGAYSGSVYAIRLNDDFTVASTVEVTAQTPYRGKSFRLGQGAVCISDDGKHIMAGAWRAWGVYHSIAAQTFVATPGQTVFSLNPEVNDTFSGSRWSQTQVYVNTVLQVGGYTRGDAPDRITFSVPMVGGEEVVIIPQYYYQPGGTAPTSDIGEVHIFYSIDEWASYTDTRLRMPDGNAYAVGDKAGESAWMSPDALALVVGAQYHDHGGTINTGGVYVYERCSIDDEWGVPVEIYGAANEEFGRGVFISADHNRVYIGRRNPDAVEIWHRSGGGEYIYTERIEEPAVDYFGEDLSVSRDESRVVAVGGILSALPPTKFVAFTASFNTRIQV